MAGSRGWGRLAFLAVLAALIAVMVALIVRTLITTPREWVTVAEFGAGTLVGVTVERCRGRRR